MGTYSNEQMEHYAGKDENDSFYLRLIENGDDIHTLHRRGRLEAGQPFYTYTGEGDLYLKELSSGDIYLVRQIWKGGFNFEEIIVKQLQHGAPGRINYHHRP